MYDDDDDDNKSKAEQQDQVEFKKKIPKKRITIQNKIK